MDERVERILAKVRETGAIFDVSPLMHGYYRIGTTKRKELVCVYPQRDRLKAQACEDDAEAAGFGYPPAERKRNLWHGKAGVEFSVPDGDSIQEARLEDLIKRLVGYFA